VSTGGGARGATWQATEQAQRPHLFVVQGLVGQGLMRGPR
jgi:hypothetical protein